MRDTCIKIIVLSFIFILVISISLIDKLNKAISDCRTVADDSITPNNTLKIENSDFIKQENLTRELGFAISDFMNKNNYSTFEKINVLFCLFEKNKLNNKELLDEFFKLNRESIKEMSKYILIKTTK